ncbi:MAG TPA: DUF4190 domain-containing protein [Ilumatobacteraceae bacterium]
MDTPPPPPPNYNPPPPPGYTAYDNAATMPQKTNGMSVASLVLSLVGVIPCFWGLQVPGLLGVIFGLIGRRQIARSNGMQKGKGLATAGLVIGIILLVICAALWAYIAFSGDCEFDGGTLSCES